MRVDCTTTDEFSTLAAGFNDRAAQLQSMYRSLESQVHEKTAQLEVKHKRLESLYEVTNLVTRAVKLRWTDETSSRYLMLASHGLPASRVEAGWTQSIAWWRATATAACPTSHLARASCRFAI